MPELVRRKCLNCGHRFEIEILNDEEVREYRRERRPTQDVRCPKCQRIDLTDHWD